MAFSSAVKFFTLLATIILIVQFSQCAQRWRTFPESSEEVDYYDEDSSVAEDVVCVPDRYHYQNRQGYNEYCGQESCDTAQNLRCNILTDRCVCAHNYVYISVSGRCEKITEKDGFCQHDTQCQAGKWGRLSRCNKSSLRCQCYDFMTGGHREVHYFEHRIPNKPYCFPQKKNQDPCTTDLECTRGIKGEAVCSYNKCKCADGWVWDGSQCLKVWNGDEYFKCTSDVQCKLSSLGALSRCKKNGWEGFGKCECSDQALYFEHEDVSRPSFCMHKRLIGDECAADFECKAGIGEESLCSFSSHGSRKCQCAQGFVPSENYSKCVKIWNGDQEFKCTTDDQCQHSRLGNLSKCEKHSLAEEGECICWDSSNGGEEDQVVWYIQTQKCYRKKYLDSPCQEHEECQASIHRNSECVHPPHIPGSSKIQAGLSKTCQCKGKACYPNGSHWMHPDNFIGHPFIITTILVVSAGIIILAAVILLKHFFSTG